MARSSSRVAPFCVAIAGLVILSSVDLCDTLCFLCFFDATSNFVTTQLADTREAGTFAVSESDAVSCTVVALTRLPEADQRQPHYEPRRGVHAAASRHFF